MAVDFVIFGVRGAGQDGTGAIAIADSAVSVPDPASAVRNKPQEPEGRENGRQSFLRRQPEPLKPRRTDGPSGDHAKRI
jgi:hypothetical protein